MELLLGKPPSNHVGKPLAITMVSSSLRLYVVDRNQRYILNLEASNKRYLYMCMCNMCVCMCNMCVCAFVCMCVCMCIWYV